MLTQERPTLLASAVVDGDEPQFHEVDLHHLGDAVSMRYKQLFYIAIARSHYVLSCHPEDVVTQVCAWILL